MSNPTLTPRDLIPPLPRETTAGHDRLLLWAGLPSDQRRPDVACARWDITTVQLRRTMSAYRWEERVRPWDDYLARLVTSTMVDSLEQTTRDLAREHVELWAKVRQVGTMALDRLLLDRGESLTPTQALAFLETAFKGERLIHGAATEHVAVAVRALDTTGLSVDELRTLRALLAKTGVDAG